MSSPRSPVWRASASSGSPTKNGERLWRPFVVPSREAAPDVDQLALAVREAKGPVQTPKLIELVDAIPQTGLGKPDKKALREAYRSGR